MSHKAEVVEVKQVTNDSVAYKIVCCGEACGPKCKPSAHVCEETWHTLSIHSDDHESELTARKAEVEARHEKMVQWRKKYLDSSR